MTQRDDRREKTACAHCPKGMFPSFQGERRGCTFLVYWSYLLWIGTQMCPWASETYIASKEATGIYSTQTKFNGFIFSGWINKVLPRAFKTRKIYVVYLLVPFKEGEMVIEFSKLSEYESSRLWVTGGLAFGCHSSLPFPHHARKF